MTNGHLNHNKRSRQVSFQMFHPVDREICIRIKIACSFLCSTPRRIEAVREWQVHASLVFRYSRNSSWPFLFSVPSFFLRLHLHPKYHLFFWPTWMAMKRSLLQYRDFVFLRPLSLFQSFCFGLFCMKRPARRILFRSS